MPDFANAWDGIEKTVSYQVKNEVTYEHPPMVPSIQPIIQTAEPVAMKTDAAEFKPLTPAA